jgi:N-dimethylarginine dimethylaminohydrolase
MLDNLKPRENIKFGSFENFIVRTENKENPRKMPYLTCSLASPNEQSRQENIEMMSKELSRLLEESNMEKEIVKLEPSRDFLKTAWQRDNFLYFNGNYFSWRWIDTQGKNRPEREAHVLNAEGVKSMSPNIYMPRIQKDKQEGVMAIGEGGMYFPDYDNNTLFISENIMGDKGNLSKLDTHNKITEIHKKIFGEDIEVNILPSSGITTHIDTHLSIIPKTKIAIFEHKYFKKVEGLGYMDNLKKLGYEVVQAPLASIICPLNILYLENNNGKTVAFLHPETPQLVKDLLKERDIGVFEVNKNIMHILDTNLGGIRCATSELGTKNPTILRKIGYKI